jgi:hypothetical protein
MARPWHPFRFPASFRTPTEWIAGSSPAMTTGVEPKTGKASVGRANQRLPVSPRFVAPASRQAAASPGSEPGASALKVQATVWSLRTEPLHRTDGRRSWKHRLARGCMRIAAARGRLRRPAGHPVFPTCVVTSGAGERSRRGVRLALCVEPSALSRFGCSPITGPASSPGISSCVETGDNGTNPPRRFG